MANIYVAAKPDNVKYITVEQSVLNNGERHLANAVGYTACGLFQHADGSLQKARRNLHRANELCSACTYPLFTPQVEWLSQYIATTILYGT